MAAKVDQEGFAVVDAMVALAILATTVVLSMNAMSLARRAAAAAAETHRASGQLRYLLDIAPHGVGVLKGRSSGFDWQVLTQPSGGSQINKAQICDRKATLRSLATGGIYVMTTAEVCPS